MQIPALCEGAWGESVGRDSPFRNYLYYGFSLSQGHESALKLFKSTTFRPHHRRQVKISSELFHVHEEHPCHPLFRKYCIIIFMKWRQNFWCAFALKNAASKAIIRVASPMNTSQLFKKPCCVVYECSAQHAGELKNINFHFLRRPFSEALTREKKNKFMREKSIWYLVLYCCISAVITREQCTHGT